MQYVRLLKSLCWLVATASCIAVAMVIQWAMTPINFNSTSSNSSATQNDSLTGEQDQLPQLNRVKQIAAINLQRPLFDPPPPPKPQTKPRPPAKLIARLTGIVYEDDHSLALFMTKDNQSKLYAVGESFNDQSGQVKILQITPITVEISYAGKTQTLQLKQEPAR